MRALGRSTLIFALAAVLTAGVAFAGVAFAGVGSLAHAEEKAAGVFEQDAVDIEAPEGVDISLVELDNRLGDISVRGHDQPGIAIQSFKRAADRETLERLVVSLVPDAKGRVHIRTTLKAGPESRPIAAASIAIDLVVLVPHEAIVKAQVWNGNLRVSGLDSGATLLADKGRIEVKQVSGPVVSNMRRGEQEFYEVLGELDTRGLEGAMKLSAIRGKKLTANLVRGTIHGEGIKVGSMAVQSVFGDIALVIEPAFDGRYRVASRKGNIEVRFHGATPVALEVYAAKVMMSPELEATREGPESPWRGRFEIRAGSVKSVRPAQLELRADAGQVLVKHF